LDRLEVADGLAELLALGGVAHGLRQARLERTGHLRRSRHGAVEIDGVGGNVGRRGGDGARGAKDQRVARLEREVSVLLDRRGAGAVWRPEAHTTTWASSHVPPAPPDSSGTSGSVRPPSSSARQSLSGHVPFSAASISSLVARSVKSRVTVSESRERSSVVIST